MQYGILHNRKTAGTALKAMIDEQNQLKVLTHAQYFDHAMTLPRFVKAHPTAQAIFFIREPISRFISGFYSRLREGKPRYFHPWSSKEARAFRYFKTPNELAEALSSLNFLRRFQAYSAMKSIGHVRHRYRDFLGSVKFLHTHRDHIAYIGQQETFEFDMMHLRKILRIDETILTPKDDMTAHKNPTDIDKKLSAKAHANLNKWYQEDNRRKKL